jgi:para-aminobenzoate synthetase/4-amino-4-deoxychorismate lyase
MYGARFDDAIARRSFSLVGPQEELVAVSLDQVEDVIAAASAASQAGLWVAGYVAYEAAPAFDESLVVHSEVSGPLAWFGVFTGVVEEFPLHRDPMAGGAYSVSDWQPSIDQSRYTESFAEIRERIKAGDTYQVNLTFPLTAAFTGDPAALYTELLVAQAPAYAAHIFHGDTHLLSVSPERFFAVEDERITTRPMKGTARRGRWLEEDNEAWERLVASEKDRAENLMIVDLLRNDLGRVAEFGSVTVDDLFTVEKYQTVWQMTSSVSADLRPDVTLQDVFAALFPCGSITGAPKASSMRIIADIEDDPRGVYCGAIGFIPPGDGREGASFNVGIRTVQVDTSEGLARYGVGGGVTWYSDAALEYDETVTKALVLAGSQDIQLVETMRWDGDFLWLEDHLHRLGRSASYWGIEVDRGAIGLMLDSIGDELTEPTKVRLVVAGDGATSVSLDSAPARFSEGPGPHGNVVVLALDATPVDSRRRDLFHKTTNRAPYRIRAKRHPGADDVVLVNEQGNVTETTIANLVFLVEGEWVTPPVTDGLLAGVMRGRLIDDGIIKERSVSTAMARTADAVAVINSVQGWRQAVIDVGL